MIGPCCFGIPLKRGVKLIALFELSLNIITAISMVILLAAMGAVRRSNPISQNKLNSTTGGSSDYNSAIDQEGSRDGQLDDSRLQEPALVFLLILLIGEIALSWMLYRGASDEKFRHLRTWWWIKLCLMVVFLIFDMVDVFTGENRKLEYVICLQVLYQGYVLWMVKALIDEIRGIGPPRFTPLTPPSTLNETEDV